MNKNGACNLIGSGITSFVSVVHVS